MFVKCVHAVLTTFPQSGKLSNDGHSQATKIGPPWHTPYFITGHGLQTHFPMSSEFIFPGNQKVAGRFISRPSSAGHIYLLLEMLFLNCYGNVANECIVDGIVAPTMRVSSQRQLQYPLTKH